MNQILEKLLAFIPTGATFVIAVLLIVAVRYILNRRYSGLSGQRYRLQVIVLLLCFVGLLAVILSLPVNETTKGQLLGLLGILLSAAIALSATTFVGNIMAGLMLRAVRNFRAGDFVRVGDHFGRVSERGLFHVEIQTEDRNLTTLPNLYLVTNPVKVVRSSGTLVTAEVSLGYDISRTVVERTLLQAAADVKLEDPFVHIIELGDFSVTYRLAGLLTDVKSLLSTHSNLRATMLDRLHLADIEIVSPAFMNQRVLDNDRLFIPKPESRKQPTETGKELPEAVVFDKADEAESLEKLRERHEKSLHELNDLKSALAHAPDDAARGSMEEKIDLVKARLARLAEYIALREKEGKQHD